MDTTPEVLELPDQVAMMNQSEETKQVTKLFSGVMNYMFNLYNAYFCDLVESYRVVTGEEHV